MCGTNSGRCFLNEDVLCGLSTVRYLSCDRIYKVVLDLCASSLFLFPWDEMTRASNEQRDHQTLVNRFPYHTIHTHSYIDLYLTTSTVTHIHTSNSLIAKGKRKIQTWLLDHHTTGEPTPPLDRISCRSSRSRPDPHSFVPSSGPAQILDRLFARRKGELSMLN